MRAGEYQFSFSQSLSVAGFALPDGTYTTERAVAVAGDRFTLEPSIIQKLFPPENSIGDHSNSLPAIILKRSTLPWEWLPYKDGQNPDGANENTPWMCLLILNEDEKLGGTISKKSFQSTIINNEEIWTALINANWLTSTSDADTFLVPSPSSRTAALPEAYQVLQAKIEQFLNQARAIQTSTIDTLQTASTDSWIKWPGFDKQVFEESSTKVQTADFDYQLLQMLMPSNKNLSFLCHVKDSSQKNPDGSFTTNEWAIVTTNRLPQPNKRTTAYLVSIQGRLDLDATDGPVFNYEGATGNELIRLVVLKQWSFNCLSKGHTLTGILSNLNTYTPTSENTSAPPTGSTTTFSFRLPSNGNVIVEPFLQQGKVPLIHNMRTGIKTVAWYQGPFTTNQHTKQLLIPQKLDQPLIKSADQLLIYNQTTGMYDVSYAAAWELGRMMMLHEKDLSIQLFQWKRRHKKSIQLAEQAAVYNHLPFQNTPTLEMPPSLQQWFEDLRLLKGVPAHYLIPNPAMLPTESIRFFQIDEQWLECLIDGAFSIGRVPYQDTVLPPNPKASTPFTGVLIRSSAIKDWPELMVDAYDALPPTTNLDTALAEANKLSLLRMDRLSDNVLLCIFDGSLQTVDVHLPPEVLHMGFKPLETPPASLLNNASNYQKDLRDYDGSEMEASAGDITYSIAWENPSSSNRMVDIQATITNIKNQLKVVGLTIPTPFTSAQLAFYLLEGVPKVRFIQKRS